jgi:hypothetical protein
MSRQMALMWLKAAECQAADGAKVAILKNWLTQIDADGGGIQQLVSRVHDCGEAYDETWTCGHRAPSFLPARRA